MCNKVCLNKKEANAFVKNNKQYGKQYRREQRAYYCETHNCWHVTSKEFIGETPELKLINKKRWKRLLKLN